jgi:hypothetical protein
MFAGVTPAPGGAFRQAEFADTDWGPRLADATTWAGVSLSRSRRAGLVDAGDLRIEHVVLGEESDPLVHRRGRYLRRAS